VKDNLLIASNIKKMINYFDKIIINFPRNEYILKDKILKNSYEILELVYFTNELNPKDRIIYQKKIISKIKMIDYYFKIGLDKKYISYKKYVKVGNCLSNSIKSLYGWIKYETI